MTEAELDARDAALRLIFGVAMRRDASRRRSGLSIVHFDDEGAKENAERPKGGLGAVEELVRSDCCANRCTGATSPLLY